jgi:AraC-like DNA-binding protein
MQQGATILASGNLASPRRILTGVLVQLELLAIDRAAARSIFTNAGLPARALDEPDFPVSLQQELEIVSALVKQLPPEMSPIRLLFGALPLLGIDNLGVVGMAMCHAASTLEALKVPLNYPELTMGHCRLVIGREDEFTRFVFQMDRPTMHGTSEQAINRLVQYCLVLDLTSSIRNIEELFDVGQRPLAVTLPYPRPPDWGEVESELDFPVRFSAEEACILYPAALVTIPPRKSNAVIYSMYTAIADKLSLMLAEEVGLSERVVRWLWAYTPPLSRGEIAELLAMSERNLTRQLAAAGTSYSELLAHVQLERACNLLRNPGLSVSEVGYRLGYAEPAAFTRAFTRWAGQSPLKWRRDHMVEKPA